MSRNISAPARFVFTSYFVQSFSHFDALHWPEQGFDLDPLHHLWAEMKGRQCFITQHQHLTSLVTKWGEIPAVNYHRFGGVQIFAEDAR